MASLNLFLKNIVFYIFLIGVQTVVADPVLSEDAQISVLTCSPGDQLYSLFGHTAFRVFDPDTRTDIVYNYGTFDYNTPNFGIKFLRGKLLYSLGKTTTRQFLQEYFLEKRSVVEQVLNLEPEAAREISDYLENNYLPENRHYKYDFYFDNCTTRIRDILEGILPDIEVERTKVEPWTFRDLLHMYTEKYPWTRFGMDLVLGTSSEQLASARDRLFLPDFLFSYIDHSTYQNVPEQKAVILNTSNLLDFVQSKEEKTNWLTPTFLFWLLFALEILGFFLIYISGDESFFKTYDKIWFGILFLCFAVFTFMWVGTDHLVCKNNWNLLWTAPWMIFYVLGAGNKILLRILLCATLLSSLGLLLFWNVLPQAIPSSVVPLCLISTIKSIRRLGIVHKFNRYYKISVFLILLMTIHQDGKGQGKIAGITLVAPPSEYVSDPIPEIIDIHANWLALVPFGYSREGATTIQFAADWQWWGEREEGIIQSIKLAQSHNMKVLLKPQVWIPGAWVGDMDFESEEEWLRWEKSYRDYIMHFLELAIRFHLDMFCIGTEYRVSVQKREPFWRKLIDDIRAKYGGKLVYSANWDSYEEVPFWDALDYIGISSYFPLSELSTPPVLYLRMRWKKIVRKLRKFSKRWNRQILFTEYGYLSVDGAAGKTWELENRIHDLSVNEKAQANAYHSLFSSFWNEDFWAGGFLWKWFPNGKGHEGYPDKDYTPQGKQSEKTIARWYEKTNG